VEDTRPKQRDAYDGQTRRAPKCERARRGVSLPRGAARVSCYASRVHGATKAFVSVVSFVARAVLAATFAATVTSNAAASEGDERARTSSLSWLRMPAAEACIATQALARSVEERLGRHVFVSAAEADVSVEGRIERRASGGWHAVITIRDAKGAVLGTRELDRPDASCTTMNEPLALIIAVMIDPEAKLSSSPPPRPKPSAAPAAAPSAAPSAAAPPPAPATTPEIKVPEGGPPPRTRDPWRFQGDAVATITSGLAPQIDLGGSIAGTLFIPDIPLGLRGYGSLFVPTIADRDGARASFDLFYLGGAVCPTLRRPAIVAMLCFGGHLGVIRSHPETLGRGIDDKTEGIWNAVSEARVSIPLVAPLALTAGVSAVLPILRPTFEYTLAGATARENLHKVSSFALAADVGVGFFFP
jgi:hypothetical protein